MPSGSESFTVEDLEVQVITHYVHYKFLQLIKRFS